MAPQINDLSYYVPRDPIAPLWVKRKKRIQECAYFKALKRGFAPGHELDDWLAAEREMDESLRLLAED